MRITIARMLKTISRSIVDLLDLTYPGKCVVCHQGVEQGARFCQSCNDTLTQMEDRPQCMLCGAPVAIDNSPCQRCEGRGYRSFARVARLAVFEGPLHDLILRYKFYHSWPIGELLADRAIRLGRIREVIEETELLVPVPLHPVRQVSRGFNQADVFARRIGKHFQKKMVDPLIRVRKTQAQSLQTSKRARFENMRNAFALKKRGMVTGKRITLVDDIITTGSTLKSAVNALKEDNPRSISVLTIAIADPKNRQFEMI